MITIIIIILIIGAYLVRKENLNKYFFFVSLVLASVSFFVEAYSAADLSRYYIWLDFFKNNNDMTQVFTNEYFSDRKLWGIYLFILSKLPHKGFLPSISVFIIYYTLFSLIIKISVDYNIKKKSILYAFSFLMLVVSFGGTVYGIRNLLAFSILARVLYIDLIEKRRRKLCFVIYLILTQIHASVIVFVLLRIITIVKNKYSYIAVNVILLFWRIALLPILMKILPLINLSVFYIMNDKIQLYLQSERFSAPTAYSKLILLIIISIVYLIDRKKFNSLGFVEYNKFFSLVLLFVIGSFWQYDLFVRSINLVAFLFMFYLLNYYNFPVLYAIKQKSAYKNLASSSKRINYNYKLFRFLLLILLYVASMIVFYTDYITMQKFIIFIFKL